MTIQIDTPWFALGILIILSFLYWLIKTAIPRYIDGRIKFEFDKKIEERRHELSMLAKEREIRFSRFHERQADAIADIYAKLRTLEFRINQYTRAYRQAGDTTQAEDGKAAADASQAFYESYSTKLIFLPRETGERLDAINKTLIVIASRYQIALQMDNLGGPIQLKSNMWETIDQTKAGIPAALAELEDSFRKLMSGSEIA